MFNPADQKLCNKIQPRKVGNGEINSFNESNYKRFVITIIKKQIKVLVIYLYIND